MNEVLSILGNYISDNIILGPLLAFIGGVLVSFTPCSFSSLPLVIGCMAMNVEKKERTYLYIALIFSLGSAIMFTIMGVVAALLGNMLGNSGSLWYIFLGILMLLMTMQIWGLHEFIPSSYLVGKTKQRGYLGAFIAGLAGGLFSSPCSTPMLVVLLALVADGGSLLYGVVLLLCYGIGHGTLAVIVGSSMGIVSKVTRSEKYGIYAKWFNRVFGLIVLALSIYMFYLGF